MSPKTAVCVDVHFSQNGTLTPERITWTNGHVYTIDNVMAVTLVSKYCRRFDVSVCGKTTGLFFEVTPENRFGPGFWYVNGKSKTAAD